MKEQYILKQVIANIEIDNREKDVVLIWQTEKKGDANVVISKRGKELKQLIKTLQEIDAL